MDVWLSAIKILRLLYTDLAGGLDDAVVNLPGFNAFADFEKAVAASIIVICGTLITLHLSKDRKNVFKTPTSIAELRPSVEILRLPAGEDHAVD